MFKYFYALLALVVTGCGGGESNVAPGINNNQSLASQFDKVSTDAAQKKLPDSSDSISMADFWTRQVTLGFSVTRSLVGYYDGSAKNIANAISTDPATNNAGSTIVTVVDPGHSAYNGDFVTISGAASSINGIPALALNNKFPITFINNNSYKIIVMGEATVKSTPATNLNFVYKFKECTGSQLITQNKAAGTTPKTYFDFLESLISTYEVKTTLDGCSPGSSDFKTTKYFAKDNPKSGSSLVYPLLGQRVEGGDFSTFNRTFDLPGGPIKSGDKGDIGTLMSYVGSSSGAYTGKSKLSYNILKNTATSLFIVISTENYDSNNFLLSTQTDVYAKETPASTDYGLVKTTVKYTNDRKNEVVIQ